jgi:hypothetical protein
MSLTMPLAGTLLFAIAALLMPSPLVALPVAVVVLLAPAANAGLFASTLRQTPEELRGRVTSTMSVITMGLRPSPHCSPACSSSTHPPPGPWAPSLPQTPSPPC